MNFLNEASSFVGIAIKLGHELEQTGFQEIRRAFVPEVQKSSFCQPRVISGYVWLTSKLSVLY